MVLLVWLLMLATKHSVSIRMEFISSHNGELYILNAIKIVNNLFYFISKNNIDGLDHAVLLVGYGTIDGKDYWLIKNSWSTYWGNDGYVLMAADDNNCGVMTTPTYVTM